MFEFVPQKGVLVESGLLMEHAHKSKGVVVQTIAARISVAGLRMKKLRGIRRFMVFYFTGG